MISNRLFLSFYTYNSTTTNLLVVIMTFVSSQFIMVSRRTYYAFNQVNFSMNAQMISVFFGGNQEEYIKHCYLLAESKKHGLRPTKQMLLETKKSLPIFWDQNGNFSEKTLSAIKKKYSISSRDISHGILLITMSEIILDIMSLGTVKLPKIIKVPSFTTKGKLLHFAGVNNQPIQWDKDRRKDLRKFFVRMYAKKHHPDATGINAISGKIISFTNKITKRHFTNQQIERLKNCNYLQAINILSSVLKKYKLPLKFQSTNVIDEKITSNPIIYKGFFYPGNIETNSKTTSIFILEDMKFNHLQEKSYKYDMSSSVLDKYEKYFNYNLDILNAIECVNQYNNKAISQKQLIAKATLTEDITLHSNKQNLCNNRQIPMFNSCNKAIFFIDSERRPVVFLPLSSKITGTKSINIKDVLSYQDYKSQLKSILNTMKAVMNDELYKKTYSLANKVKCKTSLQKFIVAINQLKKQDNFANPLIKKVIDRFINQIFFLARKIVYETKVDPLIAQSIYCEPNYWYKKTIDPSN